MSDFRKYRSLKLNGVSKEGDELLEYCLENPRKSEDPVFLFLKDWLNDDPKLKVKSSGSTGIPKIISVEKDKMLYSASLTAKYFGFQKDQTALLCLPANFIAGKMMLVRAMYSKLNLLTVEPKTNPLESLKQDQIIDFAAMIPMQLQEILNSRKPGQINKIKKLLLGGGPVDEALEKMTAGIRTEVYHGYGMTETLSHVAIRKLNGPGASKSYKALKGIQLNLDERGCLSIFSESLLNAPVISNDLVEFTDLNEFIWLGRIDNAINSGGIKIIPELLEKKLMPLLKQRFFFTSSPDEKLGEKLILIIEGETFDKTTMSLFENHLKQFFNKYEIPKGIYFTRAFIETETGKINRKKTKEKIIADL